MIECSVCKSTNNELKAKLDATTQLLGEAWDECDKVREERDRLRAVLTATALSVGQQIADGNMGVWRVEPEDIEAVLYVLRARAGVP